MYFPGFSFYGYPTWGYKPPWDRFLNFLRNYRQDRVLMAIGAGRRALSGLHLLGNMVYYPFFD
jgi:hypothetical protein